jgi:NCS1 family nucleobase:cation symporter-1
MVKGIMSSIANFATLIVNDPDFTRFSRKPRDAVWSQLATIPLGFAVTSLIGIIVSSSTALIFDSGPVWDPISLLEEFIAEGGSAQRFGVFVIGTAFALAQLGTNIAANSVSAGTDMTALLPRYLTIVCVPPSRAGGIRTVLTAQRRGGYICAVVGLAMQPYTLLKDNNSFITYLSAYSVFLSSIAGVIITDYYVVRRGYFEIANLYSAHRHGPYYYTFGVHWRAYVAYIAGILINVVGFAGEQSPHPLVLMQTLTNTRRRWSNRTRGGNVHLQPQFFLRLSRRRRHVRPSLQAVSHPFDELDVEGNRSGQRSGRAPCHSRRRASRPQQRQ